MLSRLTYTFRETWASFQRNITLTVAAILTAAVSLLIFGLTLLIQSGFDNLLERWEGGVEMIVFVNSGTAPDGLQYIANTLDEQVSLATISEFSYCDVACSLQDADHLFAGDPTTRGMLNETNITTSFKIVPAEGTDVNYLRGLKTKYETLPSVNNVALADDQIDLISTLQGFVSTYTTGLWIALMVASGLLIWNTIRTAMFARRREIEVMKLVGATDWFIRLPFMLEGLIQGLLGGVLAAGSLLFVNLRWTSSVQEFPELTGMRALAVTDGYEFKVSLLILVFGAVVGMVGSGIAASRFLDV